MAARHATHSRRHLAFLLFVVLLTAAQRAATPVADINTQRAIANYIDSGRYHADIAEVVADARSWLEQRAPAVKRPAIVLDIDETSLSNWPAYRVNGWVRIRSGDCDLKNGPCNLRKWQ
jgi:predicted secreted acid phosphatase